MDNKLLDDTLKKLVGLKTREVKLGHGSFVTMGFGEENLISEVILYGKTEKDVRPAWYFWIYMCGWELFSHGETITAGNESREEMEEGLNALEGKKLLSIKLLSNDFELELTFEDELTLSLYAENDDEDDNEQWMLFTPEEKVLTAGPLTTWTIEDEND